MPIHAHLSENVVFFCGLIARCFCIFVVCLYLHHIIAFIFFISNLGIMRKSLISFINIKFNFIIGAPFSQWWIRFWRLRWSLRRIVALFDLCICKFIKLFVLNCTFFNVFAQLFKMLLMRFTIALALWRSVHFTMIATPNPTTSFYIIFCPIVRPPSAFNQLLKILFHISQLTLKFFSVFFGFRPL